MAANSSDTRTFRANMHQLVALMRDPAFHAELRLEYVSEAPSGPSMWFHFHHGVTFTSWGEKIIIGLIPVACDMVNVEITSRCAMPTQVLDWGKNKQNLEAIFHYIGNNLMRYQYLQPAAPQNPAPNSGVKFCAKCGTQLNSSAVFCASCGAKQV